MKGKLAVPFARRYATTILAPPLAAALPAALVFLTHVTRLDAEMGLRVAAVAAVAMGGGAVLAGMKIAASAAAADEELRAGRDPGRAVTRTLEQTTLWSAILFLGWGGAVALTGAMLIERSLLGFQYFAEAALIVAAPAMAWAYWWGKHALVARASSSAQLMWRGRVWSVGVKIAIVFIGFFIVSVGALVLVIASRVALKEGEQAAFEIARFGFSIAIITTLVFAVATWFLARDVIRPLEALVALAGEMAEGRFDREVRIFSDDEVGAVAARFGVTQKNVRSLIGRIGDGGSAVASGVGRMTAGTDSLVENVHAQSTAAQESKRAVDLVRAEVEAVVAEAEEVTRLSGDVAGGAAELRASFAGVARQTDELARSVEKSSSAAGQIDAAARETAERTSTVALVGSDVLVFVAQMEATVSHIMETARATAELSQQVRGNATHGSEAVDATVEAIRSVQQSTRRTAGTFEELQKSLGQIDQILLFIDDVTNRTNLLSLNAAIIAAQAGSNDFGFSVIADEVRQLADRTRTATKEIAQIIRNVQPVARQAVDALDDAARNVDRTVDLAHGASGALSQILASADRSLDMTRSISSALSEQAQASRHLHGVTAKMSDNIGEMRRATEGQAEATRLLAEEAERVSSIAAQVRRATEEQTSAADSIALSMERIAEAVAGTRDRLHHQMAQAGQVAAASQQSLRIAERNNEIAEQFRDSLQTLLASGRALEEEVARYRR